MVVEILTGLALIQSAAKVISASIKTAKSVGTLASSIDDLYKGKEDLKKSSHPIVNKWDALLQRTLPNHSGDKFSLGNMVKLTVEERIADASITRVRRLLNARFGEKCWDQMLDHRRELIAAHEVEQKKLREDKAHTTQKIFKVLEYIAGILIVGLGIAGVVLYIQWDKK
jgi:hypothetical protein